MQDFRDEDTAVGTGDVDVVVAGAGPVGVLAANLLGLHGVRVLVLERDSTPHAQPRAFSCDDEALRIYQSAGLVDALMPDLRQSRRVTYTGVGRRPIAELRLSEVDFGFGYSPIWFFHQPLLEKTLREGLRRFESVELRLGTAVESFEQDPTGVTVRLHDLASGRRSTVRARYLVGCDGGRSTVRGLLGLSLEGRNEEEPGITISGTVAEQDAPSESSIVCDPLRPGFVGRGPAGQFRLEFRLHPRETGAELLQPGSVRRVIAPYVNPDRMKVERAQIYSFRCLMAPRWRKGRTFLVGDAAHMMPPFMGQGLVSGLRDAANLAWKLARVIRGHAPEALLDTYEQERRPHVRAMLDVSVRLGSVFQTHNTPMALVRDSLMRGIQCVPSVRRFVEGFRFKPPPSIEEGWLLGGRRSGHDAPEGSYFPQPRVRLASGEERLLDDTLGSGFAVLSRKRESATRAARGLAMALGGRAVTVGPAGMRSTGSDEVEDFTGKLEGWFTRHGVDFAVVRPDRFVFGAVPLGRLHALHTALGVRA
ncbi:bifunctional 3-(3-hydroxy-phenyl)propionate/3-hydroxycinnamic acid hydroxylase [Pyxidicoccus fallax]|uniref:Bifunctional 3-(3-hydroxy-phenyl)propionate/3-hydroxycinnamic acid hydroxylase n=1 Tax=Pyxidicoccus fallax TaxID=394095 RepID=A0A848LPK5_9BACT|nr:bifunctional 3-(3-hydroxy-phenyl)propionate/3-hydroxycinnamic acid hydroxylase [Pyxidicoccus fallax]NMO19827.1 bifunctional 3-(3-hydroxy-phenyl)propionate/3-hydroxycinnamic acid hydroxylase [Pyxidicoccus fallax]NPC77344.1 bifunctional 3-(3-hydroxy-phenyl)propionate/3-hydroxycinnamic acid hydroxylase [Pyxidicoccus fallax]